MPRLFLFLLFACNTKSAIVDNRNNDTADGRSTGDCEEPAGDLVCIDGAATICDADGEVASSEECKPAEQCVDDIGCTDCTAGATVLLSTEGSVAVVPVRPEASRTSFGWEKYHMRAVRLTVDAELKSGQINLDLAGETFTLWSSDGTQMDKSSSVAISSLPLEVLVGATGLGEASLTVTNPDCGADPAVLEFTSTQQPPITGYPLSDFPFFERVKVFNQNEVIRTTLDPARHTDRIGLPYKVYIVDHKSPAEWAADSALIDISLGTAEESTVEAEGVAENIVDAWIDEIPIPRGPSRPMDVIFDFNDNLQLDPGDIAIGPGDVQAGLTAVGDLAQTGPSSTTMFEHGSPPWNIQRVYYPENIADLGPVPLVVISHGNGHNYTWYDYLGYHLASWGYVVMAHTNNTGPGIETASTTTLTNTDSFLAAIDMVEDGVLSGQVDSSRIVWIGHSRGGEGVARAYDRMVDEGYSTYLYGPGDIILISSIAPTIFYSVEESDPHDRPYHLFAGAADGDVHGAPSSQYVQFFRILSAAESTSQMTYLQGVGHNEFNCCGFNDATGPDLIGREATQVVSKSYYLALIRAYASNDQAMMDFISRRADVFRPLGIADDVIIANTYRPDPEGEMQIIDDFQSGTTEGESAAGDSVIFDVDAVFEGTLADNDGTLNYRSSDPMNGMTQAGYSYDENRGLMFSWDTEGTATWLIPSSMRDFSTHTWISFRAAQITRHPNTQATAGSLSTTVVLVDGSGNEQGIAHHEFGGITTPYARSSSGGAGWSNEFNTIRLRISDFASGDSNVDTQDIVAVRIMMGPGFGSDVGAIGFDDLALEK